MRTTRKASPYFRRNEETANDHDYVGPPFVRDRFDSLRRHAHGVGATQSLSEFPIGRDVRAVVERQPVVEIQHADVGTVRFQSGDDSAVHVGDAEIRTGMDD